MNYMILNVKSGLNNDNLNENHYDYDCNDVYNVLFDVLNNVELLDLLNNYLYYD